MSIRAGDCLFEPALETLHAKGLSMADAVVEVKDGGGMNLIISNRGREPVLLEETHSQESQKTIGRVSLSW